MQTNQQLTPAILVQNGTQAVKLALAASRAAGGGVVLLPVGKLFIDGAVEIPPHTTLKGTSQELSTLYFMEDGIGRQLGGLTVAEGGCECHVMIQSMPIHCGGLVCQPLI